MKKFTILIAAIALVCFTAPAMAVDWNFYGNARMATFYVSNDFQDDTSEYPASGVSEDSDIQWALQGNSRFGANVKAENIKGQIEMGINESSVSARRVYGVWNFGAGSMKVGKDYTPVSQFISGQVFDADLGMLGVGTQYGSRVGQIAFTFGGFEVALIDASTSGVSETVVVGGFTFSASAGDVDKYLPKIEASWGMSFDAWNFGLQGGVNYYSVHDVVSSKDGKKNDIDVTSYTIGGDAGFNFGPGYVKAAVSYGQNFGNANWGIPGNRNQGAWASWDGDDGTNDVDTFMGAIVAGMKVSDMLSFEGGFGYRADDPDEGKKSEPWNAYVQSVIALAPGVYIIPEVGYRDFGNTPEDEDQGNQMYLGAKWQIDF
jgi:hypothetical protein